MSADEMLLVGGLSFAKAAATYLGQQPKKIDLEVTCTPPYPLLPIGMQA